MRSFRDRSPYAVGLVSAGVIAVLVAIAFAAGILHLFERTYGARAVFNDAAGIRANDEVHVAGVEAGRVTGVRADRVAGNVIVTFQVNRGVHLGRDVRAEVALRTLLGTKVLRLSGAVTRPYLEDLPAEQRVIPLSRTKTPFDVFELAKVATRGVQQTDTEKLNRLITQLADVTEGKREQIHDLIEGVARFSTALGDRDAQLRSLLERANRLSAVLAEKDQTLVSLLDQSQAVLDLLARRRGDVARGLQQSGAAFEDLGAILAGHRTEIDQILTTLHPTVEIIERRQADLDRSLAWLGPGSLGLSRGSAHGPWADIYVRALGPDLIAYLEAIGGGGT